jgi:hypothetical protein
VNIEPEVYLALQGLLSKLGMSASGYVRVLILRDLTAHGLLTEQSILKLAERS